MEPLRATSATVVMSPMSPYCSSGAAMNAKMSPSGTRARCDPLAAREMLASSECQGQRGDYMEYALARNWKAVAARGAGSLAVGLIALSWPRLTLKFLVFLFAVYIIEDGVMAIASAVQASRRKARWWPLALEAAVAVAIGLFAIFKPEEAAVVAFI